MNPRARWLLPLCLGTLYVVWGSTYLAQRIAVTSIPPLHMAAARFLVSGGLLYTGLRIAGTAPPTSAEWRAAALSAVPLLCFGMGTAAVALQRVPSGLAALIFGTVPLFAALFDRGFGGRLHPLEKVGLVIGFGGVAVVASRGALSVDPRGALLVAFAAASYAFGCVLTRRAPIAKGVMGTASQMLVGGVILALAGKVRGEVMGTLPLRAIGALLYLIVFGSLAAYSAFGWLLKNTRPVLATSYAYVNPIMALALGSALGGEHFARADFFGLLLVLIAVALVAGAERARERERSATGAWAASAAE